MRVKGTRSPARIFIHFKGQVLPSASRRLQEPFRGLPATCTCTGTVQVVIYIPDFLALG